MCGWKTSMILTVSWARSAQLRITTTSRGASTTPAWRGSVHIIRHCYDLHIEVHKRHASDDAIILEAVISGQHLGPWRGLPPTGRRVEFPLCGIFAFDAADRLAGEKIYYDRATVLRQLGVFHEPEHILGRLGAVLMHPLTMARIVSRRVLRQR